MESITWWIMMDRKFKHGESCAHSDKTVLEAWLQGTMPISNAIRNMKNNNEWEEELSKEEFIKLAESLGYRKWKASDEI